MNNCENDISGDCPPMALPLLHIAVERSCSPCNSTNRTSRVLEVGCGSGNYISAISEMIGCECHGIEPSEAMLAEAQKRDTSVLWKKGGAESLSYPPDTFIFIFCVDVIHHVSNVPLFVSDMFRTLSHRGRACIVTDSESDIRERKPLSLYFPDTVELELPVILESSIWSNSCASRVFRR